SNLIEHLISNGTDGLVVAGTTGESQTLYTAGNLALLSYTVRDGNGRIPVIAGVGSNSTRESVAISNEAAARGVDDVMLVTPYYNEPSQEGMYQHFSTIAEAVDLPVMLYNVPGRTSCHLEPKTAIRLANEVDNIVAIKDASGDLDGIAEIIEQ